MTCGYLICYDGRRITLPVFSGWKFQYTFGVPCDSFDVVGPWDAGVEADLADATRFVAEEENGVRRFTGVVDEYELSWGIGGGTLSLSGRGFAALLLDNEAVGADYQVATLEDILRDHVAPYGIPVGKKGSLPAVPGFSVETGSSEWQVLYSFARYHGGVQPFFDQYGSLTVGGGGAARTVAVDDRSGVTGVTYRDRRYGVVSEILVRDRGKLADQRVVNSAFAAGGGLCRRVITMPAKSSYQAMRYSGQFQLDRSAEERLRVELTLAGAFYAWPGDVVSLSLTKPALSGTWTVLESESTLDEGGAATKLTLG